MNSPKNINYEIRPYKFTERKMILSCLLRVCNFFGNDYQYIGFGGLAFTDFKLFHKELHITEMKSIEGGDFSRERLEFNSPYSFIEILKLKSTTALNKLNLTKKTLVWLDYDGVLDDYMFDDLRILFSKLPVGSIYFLTCNRELKSHDSNEEYTKEEFREKFGSLAPYKLENQDFSSENNYKTIRKMIKSQINKILEERSELADPVKFQQLFNFLYKENRGAKMYTFGGLILPIGFNLERLKLSDLDFIVDDDEPYKIDIPNLTRKEIDLIGKYIIRYEKELLAKNIINEKDLSKFIKTYKYVPHLYDVRI